MTAKKADPGADEARADAPEDEGDLAQYEDTDGGEVADPWDDEE